jgi:hypothetical protein
VVQRKVATLKTVTERPREELAGEVYLLGGRGRRGAAAAAAGLRLGCRHRIADVPERIRGRVDRDVRPEGESGMTFEDFEKRIFENLPGTTHAGAVHIWTGFCRSAAKVGTDNRIRPGEQPRPAASVGGAQAAHRGGMGG